MAEFDVDKAKAKRAENVYMAKLAEQAERFDEMSEYMKDLVQNCLPSPPNGELTNEERNLFSVAYKNSIGTRRASWRIVSSVEHKEKTRGGDKIAHVIADEKQRVEKELDSICNDILQLIDSQLLPSAIENAESSVFYHKMKGDYYRYICEFSTDDKHKEAVENAHKAYKDAREIAFNKLAATNPIRLGLTLNYSVFLYEILCDVKRACTEAREGFDKALSEFDKVSEENYKDSTLIMQLLRDNLTLWSSDAPQDDENNPNIDDAGEEVGKHNVEQENDHHEKNDSSGEGAENMKKEFVQQ